MSTGNNGKGGSLLKQGRVVLSMRGVVGGTDSKGGQQYREGGSLPSFIFPAVK